MSNIIVEEKKLYMNGGSITLPIVTIGNGHQVILSIKHMVNPNYQHEILRFQKDRAKKNKETFIEDTLKDLSNEAKDILYLLGLTTKDKLQKDFHLINIYLNSLSRTKVHASKVDNLGADFAPILQKLHKDAAAKKALQAVSGEKSEETENLKAEISDLRKQIAELTKAKSQSNQV